jgi:predicted Zn-dependent protease
LAVLPVHRKYHCSLFRCSESETFRNITTIGNDLVFRASVASPTLRIDGMTIAGE